MSVTTQQHAAHDYTAAARRTLADELDRIARDYEFHAHRHARNAADYLTKVQAERDAGLHKRAVADQAYRLVTELREQQPRRLTVDERADLLERLAQKANEHALDQETIDTFLGHWTPGVDADQRLPLFEDLCEMVARRDGLESGEIDYRTATTATGMDARERAVQRAAAMVDAKLWPLLHPGITRCELCAYRRPLAQQRAAGDGGLCAEHTAEAARAEQPGRVA